MEIHCKDVTEDVERLKRYIGGYQSGIRAEDGGETVILRADAILYIESVDKKTFLYTEKRVYETEKRLYELEEMLDPRDFFRCSKSVILNLNKVVRLKPEITRNILATLSSGEVVIVSRRYAAQLKQRIGV
ncbi:MAG: LytTR family transcriptional regulator [Lachnospiraceae bacterium]|nr:LytTR family transcriptional regulator [Lachnospiraceae bacterium]